MNKYIVRISDKMETTLKYIANRENRTMAEIIQKAILVYNKLSDELSRGNELYIIGEEIKNIEIFGIK